MFQTATSIKVQGIPEPIKMRECVKGNMCKAKDLTIPPTPGLIFRECLSPHQDVIFRNMGILPDLHQNCIVCLKFEMVEEFGHASNRGRPAHDRFIIQPFRSPVDQENGFHGRYCLIPDQKGMSGFTDPVARLLRNMGQLMHDPVTNHYRWDQSRMKWTRNQKPRTSRTDDLPHIDPTDVNFQ